jgi:aryl-alcohol dehydrogenase-like predicted oxidoreductase
MNPRFQGENFSRNLALVGRVETIARAKGRTPAQLALAWLLAQGPDIVPIPGSRLRARVEENAAAAAIDLSREDLEALEAAFPKGAASGLRYPEGGMRTVNR